MTSSEHHPCVTFKDAVEPGERIDIVLVDRQQVLGATVGSRIPECGVGQEAGHAYRLELDRPVAEVYGSVAVRGGVPPSVSFRQCAGSEALHLTAWVDGRRIWHGFYYLGFDLEPDCKPEEVDEAAGGR